MLILAGLEGENPATLAPKMARSDEIEPDLAQHERYAVAYAKWCQLHAALDDMEV